MRAVVVTGPGQPRSRRSSLPAAGTGEVVVDVARVGVCGTDVEFFSGDMAYLHQGDAAYPIRLGHEWCGTVSAIGDGVDPAWLGRRPPATRCSPASRCPRCLMAGHLCEERSEIGVRRGWPGALAERL